MKGYVKQTIGVHMKIIIIIPAYNEAESIENVINKLKQDCPQADYIVINDCSKDNTLQILQNCHASYINLPLNLGIGGGVQTGYKYALNNNYDIAVQIDGDGQHDTSYLMDIIEPIVNGQADIVVGSRFIDKEGFQSTGVRRLGIKFLSMLINICTGINVKDVTSGFRAVNRKYIKVYAENYPTDYPEPEAIVEAGVRGAKITELPVMMKERESGESSINTWRSIYYMIKVSCAIVICRFANRKG